MACSSPARYARVDKHSGSAGMRRFDGADGANVERGASPAPGEDANRTCSHQKRIGQDPERGPYQRRDHWPSAGNEVPEELVVAVLEIGTDRFDLESRILEQLDHRRARIQDE